jgi:hypothetical protein
VAVVANYTMIIALLLLLQGVVSEPQPHQSLPSSPLLPRRALLQQQDDAAAAAAAAAAVSSPSATSTSPAEVASDAAKAPSDCMPPNTVMVVWANRHHRPLFSAQIKNVQHRDCFMARFVFVAGGAYKPNPDDQ